MDSQVDVRETLDVWETPEFDEIAVAAEVTMYAARLED
jgi:coenzyme PQQ precursor peptide PqqA